MPKSTARALGQLDGREAARDLDPEGVVAQEDVADARDQEAGWRHDFSVRATRSNASRRSSFNLIAPPSAVTGLIRWSDSRSDALADQPHAA